MKIGSAWDYEDKQTIRLGNKCYDVHAAINLSRDLKPKILQLQDFNIDYAAPNDKTLRSFVEHMTMVNKADLKYPIILNEDGAIIDGRHRLIKAIVLGKKTITVKRFDKDPISIFTWDDK